MADPTLEAYIKQLSPESLDLFKKQLSLGLNRMTPEGRNTAFSQISGITELSDIVGSAPSAITKPQQVPQVKPEELPLWQKGLQTFNVPFQWISQNITEPFGAVVASPFTPPVAGTEGMDWFQREKAEYKGWQEPTLFTTPWGYKVQPTKGILESLPWLAVPSAGGILGKAGALGAKSTGLLGLAQQGGNVGRLAAEAARLVAPVAMVESKVNWPITKVMETLGSKVMPSKVWGKLAITDKVVLTQELGLEEKVGSKTWKNLTQDEKKVISERILRVPAKPIPTTEVPKSTIPVGEIPPKIPPTIPPISPPKVSPEPPEDFIQKFRQVLSSPELVKATARVSKATTKKKAEVISAFMDELQKWEGSLGLEEATKRATQKLKVKYPKVEISPALRDAIKNNPEIKQTFIQQIHDVTKANGWDYLSTYQAFENFLATGNIPRTLGTKEGSAYTRLVNVFGKEVIDTLENPDLLLGKSPQEITGGFPNFPESSLGEQLSMFPTPIRDKITSNMKTLGINLIDLANIPRVTLSSMDISGVLRQGLLAAVRHPIVAAKSFIPLLRAAFDPSYAAEFERFYLANPSVQKFLNPTLKHTLYHAPTPEMMAPLMEKEESMMSNLIYKVPVLKQLIGGSNRAFVTGLNYMRYNLAIDADHNLMRTAEKAGIGVTKLDYSEMANFINVITGRGSLGKANTYSPLMNAILFSPRYIMSGLQFPTMVLSKSQATRIEAWKTIGAFIGTVGSILGTAKLLGVGDVETDPRSADFGKLKIGDTRLDLWRGYAQYARFLTQMTTNQRKTEGGTVLPYNRNEIISRFVQSKASPAMGLITDILQGQNFMGEEFPPTKPMTIGKTFVERLAPLAIQDMIDGFTQSGALGGLIAAPTFLGVGVVTYMDETKQIQDKVAQEKYGMSWDDVGLKYGKATQLSLEQTEPTLITASQKRDTKYSQTTPTLMSQFQVEGKSIEETYRKSIGFAVTKFKQTNDGGQFRQDIDDAAKYRRTAYSARAQRKEYQEIIAYYNQPLAPDQTAKMNPSDILRREYYQQMFSPDMYNLETNEYNFDEATKREQGFLVKYGQQALDYIEEYSGAIWKDKPAEMKMLEQAREILRPYWNIVDQVWAMYPRGLQEISDQIVLMENTDLQTAREMLRRYPQILRARELIARYKQQMRRTNPRVQQAVSLFYS